jgi:hypothetical protein
LVVQLPIPPARIDHLLHQNERHNVCFEYSPGMNGDEPMPYCPTNPYLDGQEIDRPTHGGGVAAGAAAVDDGGSTAKAGMSCCYWCCHPTGATQCGMPIAYDSTRNHFTVFGHFCSLACAAAYNFETYSGSDRSWEIYNWIQLLSLQLGLPTPMRPAPNRHLLTMFNGPLTIDEFRKAHATLTRTYVMNVPPFMHVHPQMEAVNTSFLGSSKHNILMTDYTPVEKPRLCRKKSVVDNHKTLDSKMNLRIESTAG